MHSKIIVLWNFLFCIFVVLILKCDIEYDFLTLIFLLFVVSMDTRTVIDETNDSDCELMSETEVATSRKQNRAKAKKASKPPRAPTDVPASSVNKSRKRSPWWSHYVVDEEVPDVAECKYCHAMIG